MATPISPSGKQTIYRISYVRLYIADNPTKDTPIPFAELRSFIFLPNKPTIYELKLINNGLEQITNYTENLFQSIVDAKEADSIEQEDHILEYGVRTSFPATPKARMVIEGFECEQVDEDEVGSHFKDEQLRLRMHKIYRYCAFADSHGKPEFEYDESDCQYMERIKSQQATP